MTDADEFVGEWGVGSVLGGPGVSAVPARRETSFPARSGR